jgi:hypothetical protein
MSEGDYSPIPEQALSTEDIALGWMPFQDGVYLVRAEVERRQLTSMPGRGTISVLGRRGSQYLDWLVLRPYILREPGFSLPDGTMQEALWPEDVGTVPEHIGMVQATHYPRERTLALDQFEFHDGKATGTNPVVSALFRGVERYVCSRYPHVKRLVVSEDHSYVAIEGKEAFLQGEGFSYVPEHPARFEKTIQTGS